MRILELFCGIGSVAAAVGTTHTIVGAVDINEVALNVYKANFNDVTVQKEITSLTDQTLAEFSADLWWMSPPCQPFTRRGLQKDLADARTKPLLRLIDSVATVMPDHIALENVIGFESSRTYRLLRETLAKNGYGIATIDLCSSELGLPNLRPRFFLVASRGSQPTISIPPITSKGASDKPKLGTFLDSPSQRDRWNDDLLVDTTQLNAYQAAVNIVSENDDLTRCFTSAYGRSIVRSGSYLKTDDGFRRFSPSEESRLLGFPESFVFPNELTTLQIWRLLGNAVSVPAAKYVVSSFG